MNRFMALKKRKGLAQVNYHPNLILKNHFVFSLEFSFPLYLQIRT